MDGKIKGTPTMRGRMQSLPALDRTLTKHGMAADAGAVGDALRRKVSDSAYPVGSVYFNVGEIEPADKFGGTWEQRESAVPGTVMWVRTG